MQATWVVVADRDCATIYAVPRGMARLRQVCDLQHSRTSMGFDLGEPGDGETWIPDQALSAVEQRARCFAARVARHVEDAGRDRRFDELILVASPNVLAYLRDSLSPAVRDAVVAEIAKNLVGAQQETLQEQVLRVL